MKIKIADDFTDAPGGRYASEGINSGEEFREKLLKPFFQDALNSGEVIVVDLDGGFGYLPSFLEEAFGGLAREFSGKSVNEHIQIISNDEPGLVNRITDYVLSVDKDAKEGTKA